MEAVFTAVFKRDGGWVLGWVEDLPGANVQERTIEEARGSLKEAILLVIEFRSERFALELVELDVIRERIAVPVP